MKKFDISGAVGLLANIGVLVGIFLLIYELNQSRDMMRAQIRNELARALPDVLGVAAVNNDLADAAVRANAGEELTPVESWRVGVLNELIFRYWENVHYQYRQGLYEESEFVRHKDTMYSVIGGNRRMYAFWCENRQLYAEPFMEFMDELLQDPDC